MSAARAAMSAPELDKFERRQVARDVVRGPLMAPTPIPSEQRAGLLPFTSDVAMKRLMRSTARASFPALAMQFEPQRNMCYCGITSAVIVLNALRIHDDTHEKPLMRFHRDEESDAGRPEDGSLRLRRFTQENFFAHPGVQDVKTLAQVQGLEPYKGAERELGVNLVELAHMVRTTGARARVRLGSDDKYSIDGARQEMIETLQTPGRHVIANYGRAALGQTGFGHFSPIGAYDHETDTFLVMDVNATKRAWVWAPAERLLASFSRNGRGYLLLQEPLKTAAATGGNVIPLRAKL